MTMQPLSEFHPAVIEKELAMVPRETGNPFTQASHKFDATIPVRGSGGIVVKGFSVGIIPTSAQSGTNYYTATAGVDDNAGNNTALTLGGTTDTKTFTTANTIRYEMAITCNQAITGTSYFFVTLTLTPTLNPGTFYAGVTVYYQKLS